MFRNFKKTNGYSIITYFILLSYNIFKITKKEKKSNK